MKPYDEMYDQIDPKEAKARFKSNIDRLVTEEQENSAKNQSRMNRNIDRRIWQLKSIQVRDMVYINCENNLDKDDSGVKSRHKLLQKPLDLTKSTLKLLIP